MPAPLQLLIETGISFSRPSEGVIAAEDGGSHVDIIIQRGDVVSAAARAACEFAASWIDDNDVQAWKGRDRTIRALTADEKKAPRPRKDQRLRA